jgi:hypothetical protein
MMEAEKFEVARLWAFTAPRPFGMPLGVAKQTGSAMMRAF